MHQHIRGLEEWVAWLGEVDIPVLERTARDLADLRQDPKRLDARHVTQIVARDPLMAVKLLRHFHRQRRKREFTEVVLVERAVIMMGMEAFCARVLPEPVVEDELADQPDALASLQRRVRCAHRASHYAGDWAVMLHDLHFDEVRAAASLHAFVELLMWCFAPRRMLQIRAAQQEDPTLRSRDAQIAVFGFAFRDLQIALAEQWGLPLLLLALMDDACSLQPRVRNVALAVNLARHSTNDWNNAALPDDYRDIGYLLRVTPEQVMSLVGARPTRPVASDAAQPTGFSAAAPA